MKPTRTKSKIAGLLLALMVLTITLGAIAATASAADGDACASTVDCTGAYANGFCSVCNGYEPAALNAKGYYEIANAGQLFWFVQQVNTVDRTASAVLTADIDLEDKHWTPIGVMGEDSNSFRGVFDGQNHTIKGLNVTATSNGAGFFGEVRTGTVKNFTIYGEVVVNTEVDYVGGVIGSICGVNGETDLERNGAIIQNITSYVNVTAKAHGIGMIGGFVGYANHQSLIEQCAWYGTFDAGEYHVDSGAGGFIGKIQENTGEVTIRNCGAYGTIKTGYEKNSYNNYATIYMGGFLSFSNTNAKTTLENCLFAGRFARGENLTDQAELAAFGTLRSVNAIKNCYYLGDDGLAAVHSDSHLKPGSDNVEITSVTGAQLLSGEVAYLLGEHFGQTLEGENRQSYPVPGGAKVEDPQRFEIYDQQLGIGDDLSMKYYVMGYAPEFYSKALYMEFSHNGVKTKVYAGEPNADGFYVFVLEGINPQCMGDSIRAMLYYNETEVASHGCEDGKEYSVEKNLLNLLEKYKDDAALVALIKDTLAYGEAASAYKDHQTMSGNAYIENSSNREIPVSEAERFEKDPNSPLVDQYTVRFGTTLSIKIKVRYLPDVKVHINGKEYVTTEEDVNRGYIIFESDPISATDFDKDFSVIIQNDEGENYAYIHVSVNDYLYAISQSTDASDEMKAFAKALYNYGVSSHKYVGVHTGGKATCTHGKLCDICGVEYGEKDTTNHASDTYTYIDNGDGTHTKTHECGVTVGEPEEHTFTYSAKDNVITESCSIGCGHTGTATISATGKTYDGTAVTADVEYSGGWSGSTDLTVTYAVKGGAVLTEAPKNAGTYTASITCEDVTASYDLSIEKATPTAEDFIFTAPTDLIYDGTAKPAAITVKDGIVGMGEVNVIYFRDAGMWIDNEREPIYPATYKVGIWLTEGDNYKAVYSGERIWLGSEFEIKYLTTDAKAVISGTMGSNGWYTSDVTLTAPEGYQISKTKYNDGFVSKLTFSAEQNETITYYLKDANGDVAEKTVELKIDKTAPSAKYQIGTDGWKQFINTITFGLFCKDYKTVDIEYTDARSGVAEKQYYISSEEITNTSRIAWLDYIDTLSLNATGKYFIYMRVVDNAGNEVILNTEGIVIYEDSIQVTESVSATYNAGTDKAVTVKLNGNTVNAIQNGNAVLTAGTDYTVSADGTITLKASYLDALKAGEYTFTVSYNPQGVETDKVNMTTAFTVKVEKADGKVGNLNISGKTYDGTAVTVPTFDKLGDGAATIEYKVKGADDSTYTTTAPKNAGNYAVRVTVAEGTNHKAASAAAEFTIDKAAITVTIQNATSVYGDTLAELKATDNGIVNGDANVYSLATTATSTSNVGKYAITGTALDDNYDVTFVNGEYEITKREITITVDAKNAVVNTTLPTYTYKVEGLVGVDTLVTEPTLTCNANIALIGEYDITATGADAGGNYSIKYVPAKLTVLTDNAVDAAAGYTEELKDYDPATVTSEDKAELDEMLSEINTILADETTTDNGKKALEEVKEQVEKLIKEITDAAEATDTENTVKVENVTPENVTPENKTDLEGAKADLEKALEDNGGNYTEEEKKAIEDEIKRIDDAIEALENVEDVTDAITQLPETVEPDDEEAAEKILEAKEAYDELTDHEKSLVDEDTKKKLDDLVASLTAYDIVEGDGGKWTKGSDGSLTFTANGPFSKFVGIKIDGKDVDKANYDAKAGSTIITLKASYLDTLAVGEHTITVVYTDGSTDGTFNIHAKANSPATGDNSHMFLWIALLFISGGAVITLIVADRKRRMASKR